MTWEAGTKFDVVVHTWDHDGATKIEYNVIKPVNAYGSIGTSHDGFQALAAALVPAERTTATLAHKASEAYADRTDLFDILVKNYDWDLDQVEDLVNQAIELCKPLHRATGLPVNFEVERVKATQMQSGLSASERRRNLKDAFAVSAKLGCSRPLIVDDVMTTGATCRRLAEVLLQNGAERVGVLVVARSTIRR